MRAFCVVRTSSIALCWLLLNVISACGGATAEPPATPSTEPEVAAPESETQADPKPAESGTTEEAEPATDPASTEPDEANDAPEASEQTGRDVTYVATPEGLRVDVAGMRFLANATAVRARGGWGVKLTVEAQATDGKPHSVLNPKNGPLAFGGAVQRKGQSEAEQFGDKREGDADMSVAPGKKTTLTRSWPGKAEKPLANGDILELHVGLWGIGEDETTRKPVKQFVRVRLNADKPNPRAIIEPPPSAGEG